MTKLTIASGSKWKNSAREAVEPHVTRCYLDQGAELIGIISMKHLTATVPRPGADVEPSVQMQVEHFEIPTSADIVDRLREAQRAMYVLRTAVGTITEEHDADLSKQTLDMIGSTIGLDEAARLRVAMAHWADQARQIISRDRHHPAGLTSDELRHELDRIADGLARDLSPATYDQPDQGD